MCQWWCILLFVAIELVNHLGAVIGIVLQIAVVLVLVLLLKDVIVLVMYMHTQMPLPMLMPLYASTGAGFGG